MMERMVEKLMEYTNGASRVAIRKADVSDVPLIHRFIRELAEFEKLHGEVNATEDDLRETLFGSSADAYAAIAEIEGEPAGFTVYFFNYSTFNGKPGLYIEDLYVRPEMRDMGVGKALFGYCARQAREKGCPRLEFAVLHWNPARGFYERLGARSLKDWILYRLTGTGLERAAQLQYLRSPPDREEQ
jgi:GNAT superfamily N-acetyltransferase